MASGPDIYVGNHGTQRKRDAQAYYSYCYHEAISALRLRKFGVDEKGVPLEYFEWERVIIDECHETLVTGKSHEVTNEDYKEKARRGAREFLGVAQTDPSKRPLIAARGTWGLTGTPLLETEARVTELANVSHVTSKEGQTTIFSLTGLVVLGLKVNGGDVRDRGLSPLAKGRKRVGP